METNLNAGVSYSLGKFRIYLNELGELKILVQTNNENLLVQPSSSNSVIIVANKERNIIGEKIKEQPICPDCSRPLTQLNEIEYFCDNFECSNENMFKYNGSVLEQEKSPFTKVQREAFGVEIKNNKRISAIGARENVRTSKDLKKSNMEIIYDTITKTSKAGYSSIYIKDINISDEIKSILEKDGFLIKTNYSRGFEIKWNDETDKSVSLSEELKKQL